MNKRVSKVVLAVVAAFALIQLVPYGRDHENPPVLAEPDWKGAQTRALAERACFDCHGNTTKWPWYSHVAPVSWLVQRDVEEGREHLDFHEWSRPQRDAKEAAEEVLEGDMPMPIYLVMHPEARLSDAERKVLADGLTRTVQGSPHAHEGEDDHDDDD